MKQYTYLDLGFTFIPSGKKHQGIGNLINKEKKLWFILQRILNVYWFTIKSVVLYACESWEDRKDQKNLSRIEKLYLFLFKQILGVKNNTSSSKVFGELGRFPFRISIEKQMFKYLQRTLFGKKGCYLCKVFNEELSNKESGWVTKWDTCWTLTVCLTSSWIYSRCWMMKYIWRNIKKYKYFLKRAMDCCI